MPAILNEAVPATTQNVDAEIQATLKSANKYTGIPSSTNKTKYKKCTKKLISSFQIYLNLFHILLEHRANKSALTFMVN